MSEYVDVNIRRVGSDGCASPLFMVTYRDGGGYERRVFTQDAKRIAGEVVAVLREGHSARIASREIPGIVTHRIGSIPDAIVHMGCPFCSDPSAVPFQDYLKRQVGLDVQRGLITTDLEVTFDL